MNTQYAPPRNAVLIKKKWISGYQDKETKEYFPQRWEPVDPVDVIVHCFGQTGEWDEKGIYDMWAAAIVEHKDGSLEEVRVDQLTLIPPES
jgi:hypothetical protein